MIKEKKAFLEKKSFFRKKLQLKQKNKKLNFFGIKPFS